MKKTSSSFRLFPQHGDAKVMGFTGLDVDVEKEIPSCELIATKCIGSGVTSEVYQGQWSRIGKARPDPKGELEKGEGSWANR